MGSERKASWTGVTGQDCALPFRSLCMIDRFALHSHRTYLWYKLSIVFITELGRFKQLWRQISNRIDDIDQKRRPRPYGQIVVYLTERKLEFQDVPDVEKCHG